MRKAKITLVTTIIGAALGLQAAEAGKVRVSFDNDGDGNFVVQGFVETFDATGQTAAQVYKYNNPCAVSYSGVLFTPAQNKTTLAVVDTDDGRTLFVVHDISERGGTCPYPDLDGGLGLGFSNNFYELSFDGDGMDCLVKDDLGAGGLNDLYSGCGTSTVDAQHGWGHPNTDGIVLGSLDGPWRLDMVYDQNSPAVNGSIANMPTGSDGITDVVVISSGEMDFSTQPPDTVRLDNVVFEIAIDIKPGSDPNCFNINGNGVVPVAIFGEADFPVADIDTSTLVFGGLVVRVRGNGDPQCSIKDVNGDLYPDMVCQFADNADAWSAGDTTAELYGELTDSSVFYGEDAICIRP